jgi:undecaprenyl-diphosphatase
MSRAHGSAIRVARLNARRRVARIRARLRPLLGTLRLPLSWLARQEAIVLVAAFGIVVALFGFIELVEEMREGDMRHFDEWMLRAFRHPGDLAVPIGPHWLPGAVADITALGGTSVLAMVIVVAIGYLVLQGRYGAMTLVVVASAGGGFLSAAMKNTFARTRPDVVPHLVMVEGLSFPSGHSMVAAVIYLTLGALLARFTARRRVRAYVIAVSIALTFLIGMTRIYLGVHYPSDVLAGWAAGLVWALGCWLVARYLQYRGAVEAPRASGPR